MRQMVDKESEKTRVQITANKPARFVCGDVDREYVLPAGFELESATSNGCGMFVRFCSKSQYLKKTSQRKSQKKIKPTLCPSPSVSYQLISCFKHSTTLANAFRCIIALGNLETMCTVAIPAQRASLSSVNLRQQRASRTPPRVSTNRSERKPL